jgi:hypothetical protein
VTTAPQIEVVLMEAANFAVPGRAHFGIAVPVAIMIEFLRDACADHEWEQQEGGEQVFSRSHSCCPFNHTGVTAVGAAVHTPEAVVVALRSQRVPAHNPVAAAGST